jgi:hypothetical protein
MMAIQAQDAARDYERRAMSPHPNRLKRLTAIAGGERVVAEVANPYLQSCRTQMRKTAGMACFAFFRGTREMVVYPNS